MKQPLSFGALACALALAAAGSALAQTPSAGPPAPPAAAMPARPATGTAAPAGKPVAAPTLAASKPAAAAAPATPPPAPKPAPELDELKLFEASWKCDGKQPAGPFGPEHEYKSTLKGKKDVDGFWVAIEYDQKKSKLHPIPIKAKGFLGYDAATKKYVSVGVDNTGGWIMESASGWEGDKLVFVGDGSMMGQKISFRETYTKKSDKELVWTGEMKMGKDWISVGSDDCTK
jgi:uncharacterized protein DUF1579